MKKTCRYPSPYETIRFALWLLMLALISPACYSSTAVKGTPVKELAPPKEQVVAEKTAREQMKKKIAEMTQAKENQVFKEIGGVSEYRIGPLDVLEITSHVGDRAETTTVTVNNGGRFSYSFIDDVTAGGLTPTELDRTLTEKLAAYIKNPRIDVLVKEFRSKHALVMGELTRIRGTLYGSQGGSGKIYLEGKTSLMDLIAMGGGYTIDADIKKVKLIRYGKTYVINLYDIITRGDESQNVIIDHGDVVDIPELPVFGERVYVMGEVYFQGIYPLEDAQDLLAAVSLAGAFTPLAKEENTLIVRGQEAGSEPLVMMADMKALFRQADLNQNIRLKDGDLVYVPRMRIGDINDWIANTMPLLNFLLYPAEFESRYFLRKYMHIDRRHDNVDIYSPVR